MLPVVQRLVEGVAVKVPPFESPQVPLTEGTLGVGVGVGSTGSTLLAEQLTDAPPSLPRHAHVYGPIPETVDTSPALQSCDVGEEENVLPLESPQYALMGVGDGEDAVCEIGV